MKVNHILFPRRFLRFQPRLEPASGMAIETFRCEGQPVCIAFERSPPRRMASPKPARSTSNIYSRGRKIRSNGWLAELLDCYPGRSAGIRIVAEGDAALNHQAPGRKNNNVDLIVMANRGHSSLRRLLLGSVTMKLLHDTNCPIWTYTQDENKSTRPVGVSKIVCALEMTREAVPLLRFAQEMAKEFGASVHIVHSIPETESRPYRYFDRDLHSYLSECAAKEIAKAQQEAQTDFPITITDGFIGQDAATAATEQQSGRI